MDRRSPRARFSRQPSDWPSPPARPDPRRWLEDVTLLEHHHAGLESALATFDDASLSERRGKHTVEASFRGIALHDVYHAGQIRLVRRQLERMR